jgi:hypothetical protein
MDRLRCPKCGNTETFTIYGYGTAKYSRDLDFDDDGDTSYGDPELTDDTYDEDHEGSHDEAGCRECGRDYEIGEMERDYSENGPIQCQSCESSVTRDDADADCNSDWLCHDCMREHCNDEGGCHPCATNYGLPCGCEDCGKPEPEPEPKAAPMPVGRMVPLKADDGW